MPVLTMALLGFATWTLLVLIGTVGVYRWSKILTGRAEVRDWRADEPQGSDLYRRAMRAHMNCVETLPVFAAIILAAWTMEIETAPLDGLAIATVAARVCQSLVHIAFEQSNLVASLRFLFFAVQVACMLAMVGLLVMST